jgi:hypothetical protein
MPEQINLFWANCTIITKCKLYCAGVQCYILEKGGLMLVLSSSYISQTFPIWRMMPRWVKNKGAKTFQLPATPKAFKSHTAHRVVLFCVLSAWVLPEAE